MQDRTSRAPFFLIFAGTAEPGGGGGGGAGGAEIILQYVW